MIKIGKLEKVQIIAYTDAKRQGVGKEFVFDVSTEQMSKKHENKFRRLKGINTSGRSASYSKSNSEVLNLKLVIDNTVTYANTLPLGSLPKTDSVSKKVEDFMTACAYMDGKIHEPRFLKVLWGKINFECRLKSVEVKYPRFDDQGNPLRAELDVLFVADMSNEKRIRLENKKSPDITHNRVVRQGDTLSALSKQVYGDASYYLMVAQANELDHFRRLKPGLEIYFPPIEL